MLYFHCWSGGKESTAGIILDNIHGLPPSRVVFSEIMFDKKRGISGELPEHIDFIMNKAAEVIQYCEKHHIEYHIKEGTITD